MATDTLVIFYFLGTFLLIIFAVSLTVLLVVQKNKSFQAKLAQQQMENKYNNQLLETKLEVQEQSLKYFSEEIHDNILQVLSIIKLQIHTSKVRSHDELITTNLTKCTELVTKVIGDLRNMCHTMDGQYVDKIGLEDALKKDADYINSTREVACSFQTEGEPQRMEQGRELLIFRILQESIANALKHGHPTEINITTIYTPQHFQAVVHDNGKGFDAAKLTGGGVGLNNMQLRAGMINAHLDITSTPGYGTTVTLTAAL